MQKSNLKRYSCEGGDIVLSKIKKILAESIFWCRGDRTLTEKDLQQVYIILFIQGMAIAVLVLANIVSGLLSIAGY